MTYNRYKEKIVKGLAIFLSSMIMAGVCMPVVFADNEEVNPVKWTIEGYPMSEEDPKKDDVWFNQESLYHAQRSFFYYDEEIYTSEKGRRKERIFLRVNFKIDEGELSFTEIKNIISGIGVYGDSSNISMVDTSFLNEIDDPDTYSEGYEDEEKQNFIDKYIFVKSTDRKSAVLYVPLKPLMSNMKYTVRLTPGVVDVIRPNKPNETNTEKTWVFNTMAIPSVSEKDIIFQSVIEDYDVTEPIIINGDFFYSPTVDVYFNNTRAYRVNPRKNKNGEQYLEVYLPRGRNKLESGLYSITVENSSHHSTWLYGTLSVVSQSDSNIPEENTVYGTTTQYGRLLGDIRGKVIRLDHGEPVKEDMLRKQLQQYMLRSPILEAETLEYRIYSLILEIPVDSGMYENYKVLRYDELSRIWVEESNYYIDKVDQRIILMTFNPGIFVVVESKY